ncbi:histidine kinase [Actinomycetospora sp. NBC_00405]|uniref:histidine kinase n=1 Tax=Actinomycetospora sp. NBC_00405 TaxID=2975952 RepID=UPI002E24FEAF
MTPGRDDARRSAERWRDRQTLERRLHDGPAQRLSALTLRLGVLRADAPGRNGDDAWRRGLDVFQSELESALQELREVAGALYPPLLDEAGLGPALRELVRATGAVARVDVADVRCGTAAEGAAYFAVAACLAAADDLTPDRREIGIRVRVENDDLVLTLTGVDPDQRRPVLDEAAPLGGGAELTGPAEITARFPCA